MKKSFRRESMLFRALINPMPLRFMPTRWPVNWPLPVVNSLVERRDQGQHSRGLQCHRRKSLANATLGAASDDRRNCQRAGPYSRARRAGRRPAASLRDYCLWRTYAAVHSNQQLLGMCSEWLQPNLVEVALRAVSLVADVIQLSARRANSVV